MEKDTFKDGKAMATAVVKAVYETLTMREWYVLIITEGGHSGLPYGPFASEAEAKKLALKLGDGAFSYTIAKVYPAGVLEANLQGLPGGGSGFCRTQECGHAQWLHYMDGTTRGACSEPECSCRKHKKG